MDRRPPERSPWGSPTSHVPPPQPGRAGPRPYGPHAAGSGAPARPHHPPARQPPSAPYGHGSGDSYGYEQPYESYAGPDGSHAGPDGEPAYDAAEPGTVGGGGQDVGAGTPPEPGAVSPAVYFVAAGVVLIVALVAAAGVVLFGHGAPKGTGPAPGGATATGPLPSAYSMASSTKVFAPIARRRADARPLTAGDVFDPKTIRDKDAKASLRLTASKLDARCSDAVWGGVLAAVLRRSGCSQASRAVYTGSRYAAMVTIFNLADAAGADRVVAAADPRNGDGFPQSPTGAVSFDQGFSTARGVAMGHYAVITWIRRADGSGDETDAGLVSLLVAIGPPPAVLTRVADRGGNG